MWKFSAQGQKKEKHGHTDSKNPTAAPALWGTTMCCAVELSDC